MPGMVSDVSAIFVAMTIFRREAGEDALLVARAEPAKERDDFGLAKKSGLQAKSPVSRISRPPGMKINKIPGVWFVKNRSAAWTAAST